MAQKDCFHIQAVSAFAGSCETIEIGASSSNKNFTTAVAQAMPPTVSHFKTKKIVLPRQARDKHRKR